MSKFLVIVESPAKAKTIEKYLGTNFSVEASSGHLVDLPSSRLGVDVENGFSPDYTVIKGKAKYLNKLRKAAKGVEKVYLASDPDREGEAIAWHIADRLDLRDRALRILINEITETGVKNSMSKPVEINRHRFESQQARRILDRLVGYQVSQVLWKTIRKGISAGRVQSVALKFIVNREREIRNFKPVEYWSLDALLKRKEDSEKEGFSAFLQSFEGKKAKIENKEQSDRVLEAVSGKEFRVASVERKERRKKPSPPFITSTLQQDASNKMRFSVKKTMTVAQKLYEGIELGSKGPVGLITYMRTDSVRISPNAVEEARSFVSARYGADYVPKKPNLFKVKKSAQDAHECVRPTFPSRKPEELRKFLTDEQYKLYSLIWKRFIASQMTPAVYDHTRVDIAAGDGIFRATGNVMKFPGFTSVYEEVVENGEAAKSSPDAKKDGDSKLPDLREGQVLDLLSLDPKQHFTQPPPRYSESSLVRGLEEKGIGRPSTYASILSTVQDRGYAEREKGRFVPTALGEDVNDFLVEKFPRIMNEEFTALMEADLDRVEEGSVDWKELLGNFYEGFSKSVKEEQTREEQVPTDVGCDKCGAAMTVKLGRRGRFLSCSRYPDCDNTKDFRKENGKIVVEEKTASQETVVDIECDKCGSVMVVKTGRYGEFLSCSRYPDCKNPKNFTRDEGGGIVVRERAAPEIREDVKCDKCGKPMLARKGRRGKFLGCSGYPKCRNTLNLDEDGNVVKKKASGKKPDSR